MTDHDMGDLNQGHVRAQEVLDENYAPLVEEGNYRRKRNAESDWGESNPGADIDPEKTLDELFYK